MTIDGDLEASNLAARSEEGQREKMIVGHERDALLLFAGDSTLEEDMRGERFPSRILVCRMTAF